MFPIRDHNPSRRKPFVTWCLMAANILVFLAYYPALSGNDYQLAAFWSEWAMTPQEVSAGYEIHTLVTSMFLHGGWLHLAGNMLFLWIFGDNMEDAFGHIQFLVFYLFCGVAASCIQIVADPLSQIPVVGASGAIAGVLGGYLLLYPRARVDIIIIFIVFFKSFTLPAWIVLGVWLAMQLFAGISSPVAEGGIAYWAHAGGFVVGIVATLPFWFKQGSAAFWKKTEGHPPHPPTNAPESLSRIPVIRRRR